MRQIILILFLTVSTMSFAQDSITIWVENGLYEFQAGNYHKASINLEKFRQYMHNSYDLNDSMYVYILHRLSESYYQENLIDSSLSVLEEEYSLLPESFPINHLMYEAVAGALALRYTILGQYNKAIKYEDENLLYKRQRINTNSTEYAKSLELSATLYSQIGNYSEALKRDSIAKTIYDKVIDQTSPQYARFLTSLSRDLFYLGRYQEALKYQEAAVRIYLQNKMPDTEEKALLLSNTAEIYENIGDYDKSLQLGEKALKIIESLEGKDNITYASYLSNISKYLEKLGELEKAFKDEKQALYILEKKLTLDDYRVSHSKQHLAQLMAAAGNLSEAMEMQEEVVSVCRNNPNISVSEFAAALDNLAALRIDANEYKSALSLTQEALRIRNTAKNINWPQYAFSLSNLANIYYKLKDFGKALSVEEQANQIYKQASGKSAQYAISLGNMAVYSYDMGNYNKALLLNQQALELLKKNFGRQHYYEISTLHNIANCYASLGDKDKAIALYKEAIDMSQKLAPRNPLLEKSFQNLSFIYYEKKNFSLAADTEIKSLKICKDLLSNNLVTMPSSLRSYYWKMFELDFTGFFPSIVYRHTTDSLISDLYNYSALFAKSILLQTDMDISNAVTERGDSSVLRTLRKLQADLSLLNKYYSQTHSASQNQIDSLQSLINKEERFVSKVVNTSGFYPNALKTTWKDVQRKLSDEDLAIEFLDIPVYGTDSLVYVALTIKKKYASPKMYTLFENNQILSDSANYGSLIWLPLSEELEGVKNIYFSPAGILHKLNIEYSENVSNYNVYRLSSTREITNREYKSTKAKAILYGGLQYDADPEDIKASNKRNHLDESPHLHTTSPNLTRSLFRNGSFYELPSTRIEVDSIYNTLCSHNIPCDLPVIGLNGTEESFKALSGKDYSIIHMATHGMYISDDKSEIYKRKYKMQFISLDEPTSNRPKEDISMTHSFLVMSGGNMLFSDSSNIPKEMDDGILTAQEISLLDLHNLDLVVLSACDTGLGDVSNEGVLGLQRGFKKAGAHTIIMSLSAVPDVQTMEFMNYFYQNLTNGKSKYESFTKARKMMKSKYPGNPICWASFIMIDGIY